MTSPVCTFKLLQMKLSVALLLVQTRKQSVGSFIYQVRLNYTRIHILEDTRTLLVHQAIESAVEYFFFSKMFMEKIIPVI